MKICVVSKGKQTEHIYANVSQLAKFAGTQESYYNDDKPILISLNALWIYFSSELVMHHIWPCTIGE